MKFRCVLGFSVGTSCRLWVGSALMLAMGSTGAQPVGKTPREPQTASRSELVYLTLVGEMQVQAGMPGAGYSLLLNAARRSGDVALFKRAVQLAFQARSGDSVLEAASAWSDAHPKDPEPLRFAIQALAGMQRIADAIPFVEKLLAQVPTADQDDVLDATGDLFARYRPADVALKAARPLLKRWTGIPRTAGSAWAALARIQLAAGLHEQARESLGDALRAPQPSPVAGLLAVDWLDGQVAPDEQWVIDFLKRHPHLTSVRLAYAKRLLRQERWRDAQDQLDSLVQTPDDSRVPAETWLMLGALQLQNKQFDAAERHLNTYLQRLDRDAKANHSPRGRTQAYLSLAQIAEARQDWDRAQHWLEQVDEDDNGLELATRKASILLKTGRWQEGLAQIRSVPPGADDRGKARLLAEVQFLRDAEQLQTAFDLLSVRLSDDAQDVDLLYEQATLAERLGRHADMELLLRAILRLDPKNHHALNFLGYSLAERNVRLSEAKNLIEQALALAPNDPFITDSMGWVLYRLGEPKQALEWLRRAYQNRPDAEIAVHLGEVLWTLGERSEALHYFRQSQALQPGNQLLKQAIERLNVPWP